MKCNIAFTSLLFFVNVNIVAATKTSRRAPKRYRVLHNLKVESTFKSTLKSNNDYFESAKLKCDICPDDPDVDEGELTFAMIGALWSSSSTGMIPENLGIKPLPENCQDDFTEY